MTISIRSSCMKRYCINVTRISNVNERHHDALRKGMNDLTSQVFYQRVNLQCRWRGIILRTMHVPYKYDVCIAQIQGTHCINSIYEFRKSYNMIFSKCYQDEAASCNHLRLGLT